MPTGAAGRNETATESTLMQARGGATSPVLVAPKAGVCRGRELCDGCTHRKVKEGSGRGQRNRTSPFRAPTFQSPLETFDQRCDRTALLSSTLISYACAGCFQRRRLMWDYFESWYGSPSMRSNSPVQRSRRAVTYDVPLVPFPAGFSNTKLCPLGTLYILVIAPASSQVS